MRGICSLSAVNRSTDIRQSQLDSKEGTGIRIVESKSYHLALSSNDSEDNSNKAFASREAFCRSGKGCLTAEIVMYPSKKPHCCGVRHDRSYHVENQGLISTGEGGAQSRRPSI